MNQPEQYTVKKIRCLIMLYSYSGKKLLFPDILKNIARYGKTFFFFFFYYQVFIIARYYAKDKPSFNSTLLIKEKTTM